MSKPILKISNLSKRFGDTQVINALNFDVPPQEVCSILGPSGCGKTTVLRLIAGLETLDQGSIRFEDRVISNERHVVPPHRRGIGMVFQQFALFPHLDVSRNITFGLHQMKAGERVERLSELCRLLRLEKLISRYPHELSGGERQRVALGRALANRPKLLLLDEPFSNLDVHLRSGVREEVFALLKAAKLTTILVTHDQEEAMSVGNQILVMEAGSLVQRGTPEEIFYAPQTLFGATFVGQANLMKVDFKGEDAQTEFGRIPATGAACGRSEGSQVFLLIRPDELVLQHEGFDQDRTNGTHWLPCKLDKIQLTRTGRIATLKTPQGQSLQMVLPVTHQPSPGATLQVGLVLRKTLFFKK